MKLALLIVLALVETAAARERVVEVEPVLARMVTGEHRRHETPSGPLHVWTPPHYDAASATLVVYVHGYFTSVDDAWERDFLAAQFAASQANAMFVACGAPSGPRDPVTWPSLDRLVEALAVHEVPPAGAIVAVGHSGAYRTITRWLDHPRLGTVVRLDAAYGDEELYRAWLHEGTHRLFDIAEETQPWAEAVHRAFDDGLRLDAFPTDGLPDAARTARSVFILSTLGHHALISSGQVLPSVLRVVVI